MYDEERNLLAQLHKLAARQDENFLTEAFAHLLRHLRDNEPHAAVDLLCRLTGGRVRIGPEGIRDRLTITTQVTTEQGRPDIEIAIKGVFRCLVEVKSESGVREGQLKGYQRELRKSQREMEKFHGELTKIKNRGVSTALVLLTRYPAERFVADEHCRWYQVADWFEDWLKGWEKKGIANSESYFLTKQFVDFLKIRNIAMEKAGPELAAGVKSLTNILKMLEEAINAKADTTRGYYKFSADWNEIGFYLDKKKLWIGFLFEEPATLCFETQEDFHVRRDAKETVDFRKVDVDDDGLYWTYSRVRATGP